MPLKQLNIVLGKKNNPLSPFIYLFSLYFSSFFFSFVLIVTAIFSTPFYSCMFVYLILLRFLFFISFLLFLLHLNQQPSLLFTILISRLQLICCCCCCYRVPFMQLSNTQNARKATFDELLVHFSFVVSISTVVRLLNFIYK